MRIARAVTAARVPTTMLKFFKPIGTTAAASSAASSSSSAATLTGRKRTAEEAALSPNGGGGAGGAAADSSSSSASKRRAVDSEAAEVQCIAAVEKAIVEAEHPTSPREVGQLRLLQSSSPASPTPSPAATTAATTTAGTTDAAAAAVAPTEALAALGIDVHSSWAAVVAGEARKPYFKSLSSFLAAQRAKATVYPPPEHVFSALRACPLDSVRVVILGQDPYHGPGQAHGLAFSVLPGVPPPPSLVNILKEAAADVGIAKPSHGCLLPWARQGVLLLNAVLTVERGAANAHQGKGWEEFTTAIIRAVNDKRNNVVFMLWGQPAQKKASFVSKAKHCVLESVHPSPLSAYRGFFGCKHFSKANGYLVSKGLQPIDWRLAGVPLQLDALPASPPPPATTTTGSASSSSSASGSGSSGAGVVSPRKQKAAPAVADEAAPQQQVAEGEDWRLGAAEGSAGAGGSSSGSSGSTSV